MSPRTFELGLEVVVKNELSLISNVNIDKNSITEINKKTEPLNHRAKSFIFSLMMAGINLLFILLI